MNKKLHTLFEGASHLPDPVGDPVIFCTGQFHDQLRARRLVLPAEGLCADHCAALHLFLCALCVSLHLRGGALSDRWNKKRTMLVCDSFAAATTLLILILLQKRRIWRCGICTY